MSKRIFTLSNEERSKIRLKDKKIWGFIPSPKSTNLKTHRLKNLCNFYPKALFYSTTIHRFYSESAPARPTRAFRFGAQLYKSS